MQKKKKKKEKKKKKKKKEEGNCHFTSTPCLSSSLLPSSFIISYLLAPDEDFLSKALVSSFLVFRRMGEYISLDLFYILQCTVITARFSIQSYPYILTRHKHRLQHSPYVMYRYATPTLHRSVTSDKVTRVHEGMMTSALIIMLLVIKGK